MTTSNNNLSLISEEQNLLSINKIISEISSKYDKLWMKRNRSIDSKFLISFIFQIISNKNKGYGISLLDLWDNYELQNIKPPQKKVFAASSVCEARQKFPEEIFIELNQRLLLEFESQEKLSLLLEKHRVFAVDGSRLNLPRDLINEGYKVCNKQSYYPQGLLSCIYNIDKHIAYDFCLSKKMDERMCALGHLEALTEGDVVLFDRGYFSYLLLYQCIEKKINPIFRISTELQNQQVQNFVTSNKTDAIVEYTPSATTIAGIKRQGFDIKCNPINLRLVKHKIDGQVYVYATNLIGDKYEVEIFSELYHERWDIEELYKISKCLVDVEAFHSKTERGVRQEVYAHFVLINLARFFENVAYIKYNNKKANSKFNFKNCLTVIGKYPI